MQRYRKNNLMIHRLLLVVVLSLLNLFAQQIPNLVPILEVEGENEGDKLGLAVKGAGDLNGDGFDDFLVSVGNKDSTYLYYGGNPIDTDPDKAFYGGFKLEAGNLNGDTFTDLISVELYPLFEPGRVFIYLGSSDIDTVSDVTISPDSGATGAFGHQMAIGDLNGDGYNDLVFTDHNYSSVRGKVYVHLGGVLLGNVPDFTTQGMEVGEGLGLGCAIGDINEDGIDDLIVGGYDQSNPAPDRFHYLQVYWGSEDFSLDSCLYIDEREVSGSFGFSTGIRLTSFDINGDEINDIIVRGREVFFGDSLFNPTAANMLLEPIPGTTGRTTPTEGGDSNNDGKPDLLVSDPAMGSGSGVVAVYHGGSAQDTTIDGIYSLGFNWSRFGSSISSAGKVNGGDRDLVIVGAPSYEFDENRGFFGIYADESVAGIEDTYSQLPSFFQLHQNYPNPFNPATTISYVLDKTSSVELTIYNVLGEKVITLVDGKQTAGSFMVNWDGKDEYGNDMGSGVYLYKLKVNGEVNVKKMVKLQ